MAYSQASLSLWQMDNIARSQAVPGNALHQRLCLDDLMSRPPGFSYDATNPVAYAKWYSHSDM